MQYAVDIFGGKVWVVGCFKFIPGSDHVDIQAREGYKGSRFDYLHSYNVNGNLSAALNLAQVLFRKDMSKVWQIFGEDK